MEFKICLLVFLIFQTLLIFSEAGGNLKRNSPSPRLRPGTRATSPWRINSGRVGPSGTNGRGSPVWGAPITNTVPVRPGQPGASDWSRPQTPQAPGWPRPQAPQAPGWPRPQAPQAPGRSRPQTSQAPVWPGPQTREAPGWLRPQTSEASSFSRPQTSQASGWPRPQTSQASGWPRTQTSQASGWPRPQIPVHSPFGVSSVGGPQFLTSKFFPGLKEPKLTYAKAEEQKRSEILKSSSSSSISSTGSGYHSASRRSSLSSLGSFSSGHSSSGNQHQPIGLEALKSTAIQRSIASAQTCVDRAAMPMVIARAENCFDYFTFAVSWSPGYAYKQWKSGKHIRVDKIGPSWVIHGLWPSMFDKRKDPISTCPRTDIYFRRDRFITNKILGVLDKTWYTILAKKYSDNTKFWEHEFKAHGSCASRSSVIGNDVKYFERTLELFYQLNIGFTLANVGYKAGTTTKLRNIVDTIEDRIGGAINADYVSNPITYENYLTELFICFDTNLRVIDCPNVKLTDNELNYEVKLLERLP